MAWRALFCAGLQDQEDISTFAVSLPVSAESVPLDWLRERWPHRRVLHQHNMTHTCGIHAQCATERETDSSLQNSRLGWANIYSASTLNPNSLRARHSMEWKPQRTALSLLPWQEVQSGNCLCAVVIGYQPAWQLWTKRSAFLQTLDNKEGPSRYSKDGVSPVRTASLSAVTSHTPPGPSIYSKF